MTIHIPEWLLWTIGGTIGVIILGVILFLAFFGLMCLGLFSGGKGRWGWW